MNVINVHGEKVKIMTLKICPQFVLCSSNVSVNVNMGVSVNEAVTLLGFLGPCAKHTDAPSHTDGCKALFVKPE